MGLLDTLYQDCTGYLDLRAIKAGKTRQEFVKLTDVAGIKDFMKRFSDHDLYFGVSTRDGKAGKKDNIVEIPALWVDIDFKDIDEPVARGMIADFQFKPTAMVKSGGGLHCYWYLRESSGPEDIETVEAAMRGITIALKGDMASTDASRILRLPNTKNYKYKPPRPVYLEYCNGGRYNLSDFEDFVVQAPQDPPLKSRPSSNLDSIMSCAFMQHCRDEASSLKEPEWYAMVTILAREPGGVALIHELSKPHKGYKKGQTSQKIMHALNDAGPTTCDHIRVKLGYECGKQCQVRSPAGLAFRKIEPVTNVTTVTSVTNVTPCHNLSQLVTNFEPKSTDRNLLFEVKDWLTTCDGVFTIRDVAEDLLSNVTPPLKPPLKTYLRQILHRLVENRTLERVGSVRGTYRKIESSLEESPWWDADTEEYPILLPLGLSDLVQIRPKNIIICAGEKSATKSAFALNVAKLNLLSLQCRFFNSEASDEEYKARLMNFEDVNLEFWRKMPMYYRSQNIEDFIFPDDLNIVDFFEIHQDFFRVGLFIRKVHDRLDRGVALINLQKAPGTDLGRGATMSLEKARLYLSLSMHKDDRGMFYNKIKIVDAKSPRVKGSNPRGMVKNFRLYQGAVISELTDWHYEKE